MYAFFLTNCYGEFNESLVREIQDAEPEDTAMQLHIRIACSSGYVWYHGNCIATCYGLHARDPHVCTGHGRCIDNNLCECASEYTGITCQFNVSDHNENVCFI